ncbi:aldehyde dehydrogenase family protein [Chelatococcus composti]|jgi:NAD-dependent aldehyde dehydrogenases|uniref:aldehyde dehydrogenase (NAD(+)) n=1 Tax=Chelatococcus composti TaxID=1743235 RepID=A0A841KFS7_9HYPH|nr:aldehyde dehydrogenase family protein [Chelatococcus composti]MBB6168776.1 aldehyde dehydrogenase (NAD+) [Chelatococcus composti]MBS7737383.1 aldehyde dehydrogenase family protein [Chelatococcus composti]PZN43478.1 MAG: aldehyde dehydrogenase family protein [Pseudomonadota bacterium]GGG42788.1 aldehyde dehydrogenase [Chelatococcus composti]
MKDHLQFYIDGAWVPASGGRTLEVVNPATEEAYARIALGETADVDKAVAAAKRAFERFSRTSRKERVELLESVIEVYKKRYDDIAEAISDEMGAPMSFARQAQAAAGLGHLSEVLRVLRDYEFDEIINETVVTREPVGVCGFITPWNWPLNQIGCKVGPALAAGCTMVLKPSEIAPISAIVFTEVMHEAGVPAGVYNMVNGDGPTVGQALASHPDIDMVSFTGSTRAGIAVARAAADTVKRVAQELGGKSPNIILPDADIVRAVTHGTRQCFSNSGQSCNAPTRMLVPADRQEEAIAVAREVAAATVVGDPRDEGTTIGPVVSKAQFDKIQRLIEQGIAEGARLVAGGPGRPEHLNRGYYVRPTVFADVRNDMTIAREEIFGPVLSILPYRDEEEAIAIANDTIYGLSSYVTSGDLDHARAVARRIRAGMVHINGSPADLAAPFGGYKQSGNGREWGRYGLEDFLEVKAMFGYNPKNA